jgi:hypothetical protein
MHMTYEQWLTPTGADTSASVERAGCASETWYRLTTNAGTVTVQLAVTTDDRWAEVVVGTDVLQLSGNWRRELRQLRVLLNDPRITDLLESEV